MYICIYIYKYIYIYIFRGYYLAETILNFVLHEREHYCAIVRPIALLLVRSECNTAIGRTRAQ